jgi:hypothetical protein
VRLAHLAQITPKGAVEKVKRAGEVSARITTLGDPQGNERPRPDDSHRVRQ